MKLVENRWMFVPVGLLALSVVIGTATVLSSVVGHPLGMEPAYDRKAESWNAELDQRAANERLRWVVTPEIASSGARRTLTVRVEDKHAVRIDASRVEVECIPVKAAEARTRLALVPDGAGGFRGDFESAIGGQWEFRFDIIANEARYTDSVRRFLPHAVPGRGRSEGNG